MTTMTTTVETPVVDEIDITYCDSCADPVGDEFDKDHVTLVKNAKVVVDREGLANQVVSYARRLKEVDMDELVRREQIRAYGSYDPIASPITRLHPAVSKIVRNLEREVTLKTDGEVHVCHQCLSERFSGPEEPMYGILYDPDGTSDGKQVDGKESSLDVPSESLMRLAIAWCILTPLVVAGLFLFGVATLAMVDLIVMAVCLGVGLYLYRGERQ